MTMENWEAVNATLLWINLKTGILPLNAAIMPVRDSNRTAQENVSPAYRGLQAARARVDALPILATKGSRRWAEKTVSSGQRISRLFPRLRLVWTRHEKLL